MRSIKQFLENKIKYIEMNVIDQRFLPTGKTGGGSVTAAGKLSLGSFNVSIVNAA